MCGIIMAKSLDGTPVNQAILAQFEKQRNRGTQGFGLWDNDHQRLVRNPKENKIKRYIHNNKSTDILFHHRYPTSTNNVWNACHPFSTDNYFENNQYVLVHNGVVHNSRTLKQAHEELGIEYVSEQADGRFNDSEALLWDVALYMEGKQDALHAEGSIAFVCLQIPTDTKKPTLLRFARNNGSPLKLYRDDKIITLSSEGDGEEITTHQLHTYNYMTKRLTKKELLVPVTTYTAPRSGFQYTPGSYADDVYTGTAAWDEKTNPYIQCGVGYGARHLLSNVKKGLAEKGLSVIDSSYGIDLFFGTGTDNIDKFREDLLAVYREYLELGDGYYELTLGFLQEELDNIRDTAELNEDFYDMELIKGVIAVLSIDPFWNHDDQASRHPKWMGKKVVTTLEPAKTTAPVVKTTTTDVDEPDEIKSIGSILLQNQKRLEQRSMGFEVTDVDASLNVEHQVKTITT